MRPQLQTRNTDVGRAAGMFERARFQPPVFQRRAFPAPRAFVNLFKLDVGLSLQREIVQLPGQVGRHGRKQARGGFPGARAT